MTPKQERWLSLVCVAGILGQVVIFALSDWRGSIQEEFRNKVAANASTAGELSYPVLVQQPRLTGLIVAIVVFAIGALLISGDHNPDETF